MQLRFSFLFLVTLLFNYSKAQDNNSLVLAKSWRSSMNEKAQLLFNQAQDSFDVHNYKAAMVYYKNAIDADTNFLDAYDNLGLTYRQMNKLDSAEFYYMRSFEKDPTNPIPVHNLAVVAEKQNILEKAMYLYLLVSKMDSTNPEGHFGLSRMYTLLGRNKEALKSGQRAEKLYEEQKSPFIKDCYLILTIVCLQLGDIELSKNYLNLSKKAGAQIYPELENAIFQK